MDLDPVRFGIMLVLAVGLALITPPMGIAVLVTHGLSTDVALAQVFLSVLPVCAAPVMLIALVVAVPEVVTVLPTL